MSGARLIKPSKMNNFRGYFPSKKCGKMINYESLLERDYIHILEFDFEVEHFVSQPLYIPYVYKGVAHKYYPDFKVVTCDNRVIIVEVKPKKYLNKEENLVKYEVGRMFCKENDWEYLVVSEDQIRIGDLQYNLRKLRRCDYQNVETIINNTIIQKVREKGSMKIDDLSNELNKFNKQEIFAHIYYLIYHHQLFTDLVNKKLSKESIILANLRGKSNV